MTLKSFTHWLRRGVAPELTPSATHSVRAGEREIHFLLTAVRFIALIPVVLAVACANTAGSCNGEAVGDRKIRAECDAPYFKKAPGCAKDVDCASLNDVVSCQAASCAISSQDLCANGFGACQIDGGAVPADEAACDETPNCRWDTLCLTAADCTDFHTQDSCTAVPYCDWEANPAL